MKDTRTARRIRIGNSLNAAWFLILSCAVAVVVGDIRGGIVMVALSGLGFALAVLCIDYVSELAGGKLSNREKRVLQVVPPLAFVLGFTAAIFAKASADSAAVVAAAVAAALAAAVGVFSVWLAVR